MHRRCSGEDCHRSERKRAVRDSARAVRNSLFSRQSADPKLASQIEPIEGDIKDRGNGDYEIIYISKTAGPVEVVVTGNSEEARKVPATATHSNVPSR